MDKTALLKEKIADADMVLVGIGEEFGERFERIADYPVLAEALAATERDDSLAWLVPYLEALYLREEQDAPQTRAYRRLAELLEDKDYYIVTTCIDALIHTAGLDDNRIAEPCGSYRQLQCGLHCSVNCSAGHADNGSARLEDADSYLTDLYAKLVQGDYAGLVQPTCQTCSAPLAFCNIMCEHYAEEGYLPQWQGYTQWLQRTLHRNLCVLELGVGMQLPHIIRWPFEKAAYYNKKAVMLRIHERLSQVPADLGERGIGIAYNSLRYMEEI